MNFCKILGKKIETLSFLMKALILQHGALEDLDIEKVECYSLLVREKAAFLSSLDRISPFESPYYSKNSQTKCSTNCSVPVEPANGCLDECPDECPDECSVPLEECQMGLEVKVSALRQRVLSLSNENMAILERSMEALMRQSVALKLMKRSHSVYTNQTNPGYIDITG